ncbi:MAG TPA: hypothetical protein VN844_29895 [Pyrinomonadaceae bacterium]|nr:hypothetical protein [Pyrinomonadaceae bacterium]
MNSRWRRSLFWLLYFSLLAAAVSACASSNSARTPAAVKVSNNSEKAAVNSMPVIHVFVALADNVNQGIVPVSASLGNGDNPTTNLYWGAAFGVKTFFSRNKEWELLSVTRNPTSTILERCVFKHRRTSTLLVADAYRGKEISQTTWDFLEAAGGKPGEKLKIGNVEFHTGGSADLVAYVGHNGLMDFKLAGDPKRRDDRQRRAIILACASKSYFSPALQQSGATPLLWTTNLMAPEAYVLSAAIDGWMRKESDEQIRLRAADAYNKYQKCGLKAARGLFATGW